MEKITINKEFCKDKTLLFYPKSKNEAKFVIRSLFNMGVVWGVANNTVIDDDNIINAVKYGIVLKNNSQIFTSPMQATVISSSLICTSDQFDPPFNITHDTTDDFSRNTDLLIALFNKVSALSEEVAQLKIEIMPKHLQKEPFKRD